MSRASVSTQGQTCIHMPSTSRDLRRVCMSMKASLEPCDILKSAVAPQAPERRGDLNDLFISNRGHSNVTVSLQPRCASLTLHSLFVSLMIIQAFVTDWIDLHPVLFDRLSWFCLAGTTFFALPRFLQILAHGFTDATRLIKLYRTFIHTHQPRSDGPADRPPGSQQS